MPFVLTGLAFRRALGAFAVVKRHYAVVMRVGGGLLVLVGLLLVSGSVEDVIVRAARLGLRLRDGGLSDARPPSSDEATRLSTAPAAPSPPARGRPPAPAARRPGGS